MTRVASSQRGSAMLITLILIAAILAGAAVLVSMQLGANRETEATRTGISALYCAEAGLTASRTAIAADQANWGTYLAASAAQSPPSAEPAAVSGVDHDVNGDGQGPDFFVWLEDDHDEATGDDQATDSNNRLFIVSRCLLYPDYPREVRELIRYSQASNCYNAQKGGCAGNGNMNQ